MKKVNKKDLEKLKISKEKPKKLDKNLELIQSKYSASEIAAIAKGVRIVPGMYPVPKVNFKGEKVKFGFMTDLHLGSIFALPKMVLKAFKEFEKENCNFLCIAGDVTEGMSNRAGHVFELSHIGYAAQKEHAIEILSQYKKKMYMIDGNHDRWYIKSNGAKIVSDICDNIENAVFLGHDEGTINLKNKASISLWHGEDGSSYATSYRVQKLVEALTGGEKPNILLSGHVHKQGYFMERHIHNVLGGALCRRSSWMKSKRLANHSGFWIIECVINNDGISRFKPEWFPLYI